MANEVFQKTPRRDSLETLTSETFDSIVREGSGAVAVEFMSYGCGHCREIEPIVQRVAEQLKQHEAMFRVNTAIDQELADNYHVEGTPTFVMFLDGNEVGRVEGPSPVLSSLLAAVTEPFER